MTLKEAESDKRFEQFKLCNFLELLSYITKCHSYLAKDNDPEVREFLTAAELIRDSRLGKS